MHGKWKGCKKLLLSNGTMSGIYEIPTQDEYDADLNKKIAKLGELNELACKDLILAINTSSSVLKVLFRLVKNAKSLDYPEGNCNVTWNRQVSKYAPHTALSLL